MMLFEETDQDRAIHKMWLLDNYTDEWLLISSPYPVTITLAVYLLFVLKLGPQFMKSRPPMQLDKVMRFYNLMQVLVNGFLIIRFLVAENSIGKLSKYNCVLEDLALIEIELKTELKLLLFYAWFALCLKIFDLLDTVFMVLRKKNSHVTFLHVYHHFAMVFFTWLSFRYRSHQLLVPGLINITVHAIMYSYYYLATFPELKPKLWWKQHLTKLQLIQFVIIICYFLFMYNRGCYMPRILLVIWVFNVAVICMFFVNFYCKAYLEIKNSNDRKKL